MKYLKFCLPVLVVLAITFSIQAHFKQPPNKPVQKFKRGLRPTPRHVLISAPRFVPKRSAVSQVAYVPSKLSMWLNDQYGDCVTAEEAFAKACTVGNVPGVFISDAVVQAWCNKNGTLNGADLDPVVKQMQAAGFAQDGNMYNDGADSVVDYSTESVLQAAIAVGPVKIGIDADALPSGAGNNMGWVATGGSPGQYSNEDHCIDICGYGPAGWLCTQLQVTLPSGLTATQPMYLAYTWSTIGLVDHPWIMSTCGEAWSRAPTTIIVGTGTITPDPPLTPQPPPVPTPPVPTPTPPVPTPTPPVPTPTPPFPTPTPPFPTPTPVVTPTITTNVVLQPATYELLNPGTTALIQQLFAVNGPNIKPAPTPGTIEQRMTVVEGELRGIRAALDRIIGVQEVQQKVLMGGKQ